MPKFLLRTAIATFFLIPATLVQAQTLKERKAIQTWKEWLLNSNESSADQFKKKCGYEITYELDEKFAAPFLKQNSHAGAFCDHPRQVMSEMCLDNLSKEAITASVQKIICKYDPKEKNVRFSLNKSTKTLEMIMSENASDLTKISREFLENNL